MTCFLILRMVLEISIFQDHFFLPNPAASQCGEPAMISIHCFYLHLQTLTFYIHSQAVVQEHRLQLLRSALQIRL